MNFICKIINWLCNKFNYIPDNAQKRINQLELTADERIQEIGRHLQESTDKLLIATREIEELRKHVEQSKVLDMETLEKENNRLNLENDKIRHDLKEANKYFEEVEAQVCNIKRSMCFPGASTITSFTKDNSICIAGRIVLEDSVSAKMQELSSISERYYLAHNQ